VVVSLKNTTLVPIYYALSGDQQTSAVKEGLQHDLNPDNWKEHEIKDSSYLVQPSIVRLTPGTVMTIH
jgi:hypothetical protein